MMYSWFIIINVSQSGSYIQSCYLVQSVTFHSQTNQEQNQATEKFYEF